MAGFEHSLLTGQHTWKEVLMDNESMSKIFQAAVYVAMSEEEIREIDKYEEDLENANKCLLARLEQIIEERMTEHQKKIIYYRFKLGLTYSRIAKILNRNYTCIPNALLGIKSKKYGGKYHGGIVRKLKKYAMRDGEIIKILADIKEIRRREIPQIF